MPRRIEPASEPTSVQLPLFDVGSAGSPLAASLQAVDDANGPRVRPAAPSAALDVGNAGEPPQSGAAAGFRHPGANHESLLNGHTVAYVLRRVRRRSIGFIVGADGLCVNAPRWVGVGEIERALTDKAGWILRKLAEQHERAQRLHAARVRWGDGLLLPFLGRQIVVVLDPTSRGTVLLDPPTDGAPLPLRIGLPLDAEAPRIRAAVQAWLQRQARQLFEARCQFFGPRLGVRPTRLSLSSARTRWGSASASGAVRLNWRLVHFTLPTVDYVVAHELAHLREMNHGARFWEIVASVVPDYRRAVLSLKDEVLPVFD